MSRHVIVAALLAALLVAPDAAPAQTPGEEDAIKALVQTAYVDGLQNLGDLEKTRAGFHPDFVLLGLRDGTLTRLPIAEWIASAGKRKADGAKPPLTTCKFLTVDVTGSAASVKLELHQNDKRIFTDYLSLSSSPMAGRSSARSTTGTKPATTLDIAVLRRVRGCVSRRCEAGDEAVMTKTKTAAPAGAASRSRLLKRIDTEWQNLLASCDGLSDAAVLEPGVTGTWSVKDIIAHVTVWENEALEHLPVVLAGRRPPRYSVTHGGINAFNAQMTQRNRDLPLPELLRRRDDTHTRLVEFIERVPESECGGGTRFRRRLRLDTYGHYRIHARAIQQWRKQRSPA